MTEVPKQVIDYAPTLVFSKGEKYFPCDIFFAGHNVVNNKQEYDKLSEKEKLRKILCYYHITNGRKCMVYQYWYYYAYNPYRVVLFFNNHEHDFESAKIFVGKKSQKPKYIICNIHEKRNSSKINNGKIPHIHVELGGHGLLPEKQSEPWVWFGKKDENKRIKVVPKKLEHSCENLRLEVLKQPIGVIDTDLRIVGDDFSPKRKAPQVPWIRGEYYLPEHMDELTKIERQKRESYIQPFGRIAPSIKMQSIMMDIERDPISSFQFTPKKKSKGELFNQTSVISFKILFESGITSYSELVELDPNKLHSKLENYIKEKNLKIPILSTEEIRLWQKGLINIFGR